MFLHELPRQIGQLVVQRRNREAGIRYLLLDNPGGLTDAGSVYVIRGPNTVQSVDLDVKPCNAANKVNVKSRGVIPVAIYTTSDFDAARIDASTVLLAGVGARQFAFEDVDHDGDLDLILHFRTQEVLETLGLDLDRGESESVEVELTGKTVDDALIQGFDTINFFMPGNRGKKK